MTEIQRLLTQTIDDLNSREKRDNRPRFSISFIRKHPGLFLAMYAALLATLAVMLLSETLVDSVWLLVVLFVVFNVFFFFDVNPRYRYEDIDVLDFRVCYNGEWYFSREISEDAVQQLLASNEVSTRIKNRIEAIVRNKGAIDFYDVYDLARQDKLQFAGSATAQAAH